MGLNDGNIRSSLIESIMVEAYGGKMALINLALISNDIKDRRSLRVSPYDIELIGSINRALQESNLGLNIQIANTSILVRVPVIDDSQRSRLIARAKSLAEQQRIAIRNIRKDLRNKLKRDSKLESNDSKIESLTRSALKKIDELLEIKISNINYRDPNWNK